MGSHMADGSSAAFTDHDGACPGLVQPSVMPPRLANGVLDALPDSIAVLDQSGTIVAVNEAWERFERENGGTVRASGIGADYLAVCQAASNDESAQQTFDGLRIILSGTQMCFMLEYPCHSPTKQRWFLLRAMPAPDAQGRAIVVHSDITAHKLLEQTLVEQKRRYEALLAACPDHIFMLDPVGRFTFVNPAAAAVIVAANGRPADEIMGRTPRELGLPPEFVRQFEQQQTLARGGKTVAAETLFPDPRGVRMFEYALSPIYAKDGRLEAISGITRDIEERTHRLEDARASELAAQELSQQLDEFFAIAAHDIRSPITALKGSVDLAYHRAQRLVAALEAPDGQAAGLAARLVSALDNAEASSKRLLRLVEVLFDVARARTGTLSLTVAPCDLGALVHEQVTAQQAAAPGRTIQLYLPDGPVQVIADVDRLGQVLTNYLANALKYSPDDQLVVVRLEVTDGLAEVSVRDSGPGLSAEEQRRVWELHHRAPGVVVHSGASITSGSLGLGLHICKRLVELHTGGQVGVESVVGKGSTFWFRLPVAAAPASDAHSSTQRT